MWVGSNQAISQIISIPSGQGVIQGTLGLQSTIYTPVLGQANLAGRTVYLDLKGDGTFDPGDPSTITDAYGNYTIAGVTPGTYTVRLRTYPGDVIGSPAGGGQPIYVAGGALSTATTFGLIEASPVLPLTYNLSPFGTANPDISTAEVIGLYSTILGRAPDPAGLAFYVSSLKNGVPVQVVADDMLHSAEYDATLVASDYENFLDHVASPSEINAWVTLMRGGLTAEQVAADFLGSDVFTALHPDNASFITALYQDLPGYQPAPSEVAAWQALLTTGTTRATAVRSFLSLSDTRAASGLFALILQRQADADGFNFYLDALQAGVPLADAASYLFGSAEYAVLAEKGLG